MSEPGTLHCIGVGPGDPELVTIRAARLLGSVRHVVAPIARLNTESLALSIVRRYLREDAIVRECVFPMTADRAELSASWSEAAAEIDALLLAGHDVCFPTIGDPLLYSTAIYLSRALRSRRPMAKVSFVAGVTAFSAVAATTQIPLGEAKQPVTIVPGASDLDTLRRALARGGAVVVMKLGARLGSVLEVLAECGALGRAALVSRAGLPEQRVHLDLTQLRTLGVEAAYLATLVVSAEGTS